jgi:hypothetical protein
VWANEFSSASPSPLGQRRSDQDERSLDELNLINSWHEWRKFHANERTKILLATFVVNVSYWPVATWMTG